MQEDGMGGTRSKHGKMRNVRTLVGNAEGKRPLVRPRRRWDGNIKLYLKETVWVVVDWIHMV
jgi:hypothetical protein